MLLILGLTGLGLAWLFPGHYPPWTSFEPQLAAAAGVGLVAMATLSRRAQSVHVPPLACVVLAASAIPWFQWFSGQILFLQDALTTSLYVAGFGLCIACGATLATSRKRDFLEGLGLAVIVAGIASTGLALLQWLGLDTSAMVANMPRGGRPFANLAQPNHLCTLLALGVVAALGGFERGRFRGWVVALLVAFFGFGMIMTQSRTGWVFVLLVVVWWAFMRRRAGLRLSPLPVFLSAGLFAAGVLLWQPLNECLLLSTDPLLERLHASLRWQHWSTLWDAIWRSPWFGYGWNQVTLAQQAAVLDHPAVHEWLLDSHNVVLDLLVWNGVPIGLALTCVLVWWFVRQVRACRTTDQWALIAGVGAIFLHGMLEYPLDYTYFLFPAGLMMGALDGLQPAARSWRVSQIVYGAALAAMLVMLGWVSTEYLTVQTAATRMRFVMAGIGVDKVSTAPVPDVRLLDALREYHRYWLTPVRAGESAAVLDWQRNVTRRYAAPPAMLRYALAAGINGRPDEATQTLARLCKMHAKERYEEGQQSWTQLQKQYPQLLAIDMPPCR